MAAHSFSFDLLPRNIWTENGFFSPPAGPSLLADDDFVCSGSSPPTTSTTSARTAVGQAGANFDVPDEAVVAHRPNEPPILGVRSLESTCRYCLR